jgi:tRNA-modifying protein YgfZ
MMAPSDNVIGEYLALRNGAGVVVDRFDAVWIRGADTISFLQATLTQDMTAYQIGDVTRAFLLTPKGRVRALLWVLVGDAETILLCDTGSQEEVLRTLMPLNVNMDITIDAVRGPVIEVIGPMAGAVVADLGYVIPDEGHWAFSESGHCVAAIGHIRVDLARFVLIGPSAEDVESSGGVLVGSVAAEAIRIEAGEPQVGRDVPDTALVHEVGALDGAVSFTKGCYLGQEMVERIDSRGHVNQRIVGVVVGTNVIPPPGAEIVGDSSMNGKVTSTAESLELRAPIVLATVRREVAAGDSVSITWDGGSAPGIVRELPLDRFIRTP